MHSKCIHGHRVLVQYVQFGSPWEKWVTNRWIISLSYQCVPGTGVLTTDRSLLARRYILGSNWALPLHSTITWHLLIVQISAWECWQDVSECHVCKPQYSYMQNVKLDLNIRPCHQKTAPAVHSIEGTDPIHSSAQEFWQPKRSRMR